MPHVYGLDEASQKVATIANTIARTVAAKHAADVDTNARFPEETIAALAKKGLLGLCVPTDLGGLGLGPRAFVAVVEELAQCCSSSAMIFVMHVTAQQAISAGSLAGRDDVLRAIAGGQHLSTLALSERGSRSQFWAPVSKLANNGDGFTTNAHKSWITSASRADSYIASAQKPGAASPLESTIYIARKGSPGIRVDKSFDGLGLRGNDSSPVTIENLAIAKGDLLTDLGAGAPMMLEVILPWFAIGTAAMSNGICRASIAATAEHLQGTSFEHTASALRDLPNLRARLAQMSVRTEQSRALLGYTLGEIEKPSPTTPLFVLQSRLGSLEGAVEVTDLAMKTCGGAAFSKHLPVERLFRDARAGWVMAPTVDHLQDFVGKALTGLPLF